MGIGHMQVVRKKIWNKADAGLTYFSNTCTIKGIKGKTITENYKSSSGKNVTMHFCTITDGLYLFSFVTENYVKQSGQNFHGYKVQMQGFYKSRVFCWTW